MIEYVNMSKTHVCAQCDHSFSTIGNLNKHAVRCKAKMERLVCDFCGNTFATTRNLNRHKEGRCKVLLLDSKKAISELKMLEPKLETKDAKIRHWKCIAKEREKEIFELKAKIQNLEGQITGIHNAPARTVKNVQNNNTIKYKLSRLPITQIKPLTTDTMKEHLKKKTYTDNLFDMGLEGYLELFDEIVREKTDDGIVERNYVCTDSSRHKFRRLSDARLWESDIGGMYIEKFVDIVQPYYETRLTRKYKLLQRFEEELETVTDLHRSRVLCLKVGRINEFIKRHEEEGLYLELTEAKKRELVEKLRCKIKRRYEIESVYDPDDE